VNTHIAESNASDPTERVRALMEITQSLSAIFARENELLETRRPREIAPLQAEKARLAAAYAQSIREVAQNRNAVQTADSGLLQELREITAGFEERAARQRSLLEAAAKAGEGVVKAIADEAAAQSGAQGYGAKETAPTSPISVNEEA
jgi:hypothetical protein